MPNSIPSTKPSKGKLAKHAPISERPTKRRRVSPEPEPERELVSQRRTPDLESELDESSDSERPDAASSDIDSSEPEEAEQAIPDDDNGAQSLASSFEELGITESLCDACKSLGYTTPTPIQSKAIPIALQGRDVIGVAETGSGKTAAFALPILQSLLDNPRPFFGLVLAPTRDLAIQIGKAFEALGSIINARAAVIVGGVNMVEQMRMLAKKPHVIVATPGRLLDHLEKSKGFSLHALKYLVMDEADKLLDLDFGPAIEKICKKLPRDRNTFLFSATMSTKVERLQRANLRDPVRVSVSKDNHQTASNLKQLLWVIPQMHKDLSLVYLMHNFAGKSVIVFVRTYRECQRLAIFLRQLGFAAVPLYGKLPMSARISVLNKFRAKSRDILVATDVAARGLDIPNVDLVVNFDLPQDDKTYVHRVGRTARAGKSGTAINMCTQYGIEVFLRIEHFLGIKMDVYEEYDHELLKPIEARVEEAQRTAKLEMKDLDRKQKERDKKRKKGTGFAGGNDEDEG